MKRSDKTEMTDCFYRNTHIARAKAEGKYKGRKQSIDVRKVKEL